MEKEQYCVTSEKSVFIEQEEINKSSSIDSEDLYEMQKKLFSSYENKSEDGCTTEELYKMEKRVMNTHLHDPFDKLVNETVPNNPYINIIKKGDSYEVQNIIHNSHENVPIMINSQVTLYINEINVDDYLNDLHIEI